MKLYPLKFNPIYKYRMWGGDKLKNILNKKYTIESVGESWEISNIKGAETTVINGELKGWTLNELIQEFKEDFMGSGVYETFKEEFPLLIKFIDAKKDLSIQVHPDDEIAKERHNSFGKNEMWYIMQADKDASLVLGFSKKVNKELYSQHVKNATIMEILNVENVEKGDTFFIPAGRIHGIGSGVVLAEIQQTSDLTYRIYDFDRVDKNTGEKRELHNKLAKDVINFEVLNEYKTTYKNHINTSNHLVHTPFFKTNMLKIKGRMEFDYSTNDAFVIYICTEGNFKLSCFNETYTLKQGETLLLPASINKINIDSDAAEFIEVTM